MKNKIIEILFIIVGISLIGYPIISNYLASYNQTVAISNYQEDVNSLSIEEKQDELEKAREYNKELEQTSTVDISMANYIDRREHVSYLNVLNIGNQMGYISIPKIDVYLPIYHGISEDVLQAGVGHIENTALPIGGKGTHAVLAGHTGLVRTKMFDDINKLGIGDKFYIHVLDEVLTYEVDKIDVVLPDNTDTIVVKPEEDYITLVTCTPYMLNTHRLLVRGVRSEPNENINIAIEDVQYNENEENNENIINIEKIKFDRIKSIIVVSLIFIIIISIFIIYIFDFGKKKKYNKKIEPEDNIEIKNKKIKKEKKVIISQTTKRNIAIIIIIVGILVLIYPYFLKVITSIQMNKSIDDFIEIVDKLQQEETEDNNSEEIIYNNTSDNTNSSIYSDSSTPKENIINKERLDSLYEEMKEYNKYLNEEGQEIVDAFSFEALSFDLTQYGFKENIIGIIEIPKINVKLPIYLGATVENLSKGATHLSQTSMPLGETNSNVVIAAHRGLVRNNMFRYIDKLGIGDEIIITTFWDKLRYSVSETRVIYPTDTSQILIKKDKDLVTLVTCHPYRINNQRYVVYCERVY